MIKPKFEGRLKAYIKGIAKRHKLRVLAINGTDDHIHLLMDVPSSTSVSKAVQHIKGGSSKWLNDHFFEDRSFRWQKGYAAFSINESLVATTVRYIEQQKKHHIAISGKEELTAILNKHGIPFNEETA